MCRLPTLKPKWLRRLRKGFDGIADAIETLKKREKLWKKLEERNILEVRDDIHVKLECMNVVQLELVLEAVELIGEATEEFGKQDDYQQSATTLVQDPQPGSTFEMDILNITNEHTRAQEEIRKQLENDDLEGFDRMVEEREEPLSNAQMSLSSERRLSSSLESEEPEESEESEESEEPENPETYRKWEETESHNRQRAESNFQEKLKEIVEKGEENARKAREERERFEAETEDLRRKRQAEWEAGTAALIECIRLKWRFEKEEDALASWLKLLKNSILTVKGEFSRLEQQIGFGNFDGSDIKEKLGALHDSVEQSYDTVYKAFENVRELCSQFPDRLFLRILQKNLVDVLNKQCGIMKEIDNFEANPIFDHIREAFHNLNPTDIPTTWKLKEDSLTSNFEDYCSEEEPEVYVTMKIEKIL